jgi:uncharacterized UBP type Zn finger protein
MSGLPRYQPVTESGQIDDGLCSHTSEISQPVPEQPAGCEDCLREGSRWVHLRVCLSCGHVGCCDSSPRRHATGHWKQTGHHVMASAEPGEDWAWCFEDEVGLVPVGS